MTTSSDHEHEIDSGKGVILLSELGHLLPGMADMMPLIADRIWKCYYAGKAHNKPLARFELKEAVILMEKAAILRPKYSETMEKFITEMTSVVAKTIDAEDWDGFEKAYTEMIDGANAYHEMYDKGFLRWKMPDTPPPDLDFTP